MFETIPHAMEWIESSLDVRFDDEFVTEVTDCIESDGCLDRLIDAFAYRYNTYRPHDALGQQTPKAYLESLQAAEDPPSHMC